MSTNQSGLVRSRLFRAASVAAQRFGAGRAYRNTVRIWELARWMDTPAVYRAAECAAGILRDAGIDDVRIEDVPADGKTVWNGSLMPIAWQVKDATLESDGGARDRESFADYALDPQSVATVCPATPGNRFVQGSVAIAEDVSQVAGLRLKNRFLLLRSGKGSIALNMEAARKGALGVLVVTDGPTPEARAFLNAAIPMAATQPCVPCFSLSREAAGRLEQRLAEEAGYLLRARVRAKRIAGTAPMLTGTVGSGEPKVYLCAHIDEIGALDNASGCGVALEALRTLQKLNKARSGLAQRRAIRFFFSTEVRGQQAWFNMQQSPQQFLGGMNIDMIGSGATSEPIVARLGFPHRPHFAGRVLADLVALANRQVTGLTTACDANYYVSDGLPGIYSPGGNVSIEQKPGPTYHSSADTPAMLNRRALQWGGFASVAWLYAMTRMDGSDAVRIARRIHDEVLQHNETGAAATDVARALCEMKTLFLAIPRNPKYGIADTPAGVYSSGVRRRSGLWPEIEQKAELQSWVTEVAARRPRSDRSIAKSASGRAERLAPRLPHRGFLNFDAHVNPKQIGDLRQRTGLRVDWCTEQWAWISATCLDGKQTVADVIARLADIGIDVQQHRLLALAEYLIDVGMAQERPILNAKDIRTAVRGVGVKRGSTLLVHASLSEFGYVRGGEPTMVQALLDVLGPTGSLLMPTHSNSVLGYPPYDVRHSPSNTGAVTEYFRKMPGVVRSAHPTHSVAGIGPSAAALLEGHPEDVTSAPLARDGFWGRFYDAGGDVLLMCPIQSATAFHAGETWVNLPLGPLIAHAIDVDTGRRRVVTLPHGPWHTGHFESTMARPLMRKGLMSTNDLGESVIHLAPVKTMIDISVEVNRRDPRVSIANGGTCDCFYCKDLRAGLAARGAR